MTALSLDDTLLSNPRVRQSTSNGTGTIVATDDGRLGTASLGIESGHAFWDGDDMSLEMVTDINDGDVDEEVNFFSF